MPGWRRPRPHGGNLAPHKERRRACGLGSLGFNFLGGENVDPEMLQVLA